MMDYHSSRWQIDADKRAKESMQLDLYALAYKNIFGKLPKRAELHFLESGIVGSNEVKEKDIEKITGKIHGVSEGIRKQSFNATPAFKACTYCAYSQICPSAVIR